MNKNNLIVAILVSALFGSPSSRADNLIVATSPFSSTGQAVTDELGTREEGQLNGVHYQFYYSDGSGSFAGEPGNTLDPLAMNEKNWNVRCQKNPISDHIMCIAIYAHFYVFIHKSGAISCHVGTDNFPGSSVALRIATGIPFRATEDTQFSSDQCSEILQGLRTGVTVTTQYMEWPNEYEISDKWQVFGFQEVLSYLRWAVAHIP